MVRARGSWLRSFAGASPSPVGGMTHGFNRLSLRLALALATAFAMPATAQTSLQLAMSLQPSQVQFTCSGAGPGHVVVFLVGTDIGHTEILPGVAIALQRPNLLTWCVADAAGQARFGAGFAVRPLTIAVQALALDLAAPNLAAAAWSNGMLLPLGQLTAEERLVQDLYNEINRVRAGQQLRQLTPAPQLAALAQGHCDYMAAIGQLTNSDPAGSLAGQVSGLPFYWAGQLLAWSTNPTAAQLVSLWLGSPDHRNYLLDVRGTFYAPIGLPLPTHVGVAVRNSYVTVLLGCARQ